MTDEELTELERLEKAATPGPWTYDGSSLSNWHDSTFEMEWCPNGEDAGANEKNDGALIAAARNALPKLLAELRRLRARDRWIPAIDRLPKRAGNYLVVVVPPNGRKIVSVAYFEPGCWTHEQTRPSHWQPLPEAP